MREAAERRVIVVLSDALVLEFFIYILYTVDRAA